MERADALRNRAKRLAAIIRVQTFRSSDDLRQHALVLRTTSLFGRFGRTYRAAQAAGRELARGEARAKRGAMAVALEYLAEYLDDVRAFSDDSRLRRLCGPAFHGVDTQFAPLLALCRYASDVRTLTVEGDETDLTIRGILLGGKAERLRELADLLGRSSLKPLIRALSDDAALSGNLVEMHSRLQGRLATLEQLSEGARLLGLRTELRLRELLQVHHDVKQHATLTERVEELSAVRTVLANLGADLERPEARLWPTLALARSWHKLLGALRDEPGRLPELLFSSEADRSLAALGALRRELQERLPQVRQAAALAAQRASLESRFFKSGELGGEDLVWLGERLAWAIQAREMLPGWLEFRRAWRDAETEGPAELFKLFERLPRPERMGEAYKRVLYRSLVRLAYEEHPELKRLSGLRQEEARDRFRELDREILDLERQEIAARLCGRPITSGNSAGPRSSWTQLALVRHQIALQRRHLPIRQLMTRAGHAIQDMMPCFMMSPISVAQFLDPKALDFDLIVIDEASQMPPEEAVGAIARGHQLVVVGDPMQLPPTAFFQRLEQQDEDDDAEDFGVDTESILDLCLDVFHPFRDLRWHYRSRHESLIAFSNHHFYDDRLIVFPTPLPRRDDHGVGLHHVAGTYLGHGVNRDEVKAVCAAVVRFMQRYPVRSLGVVTLNRQQAELLRDEFERLERREVAIQEYIARWDQTLEPFFIKNLENVQGDERDVIFISAVYGRDASGQVLQRFGPINSTTGHRRLNVLFTRAKERVEVFASLVADDIRAEAAAHRGVRVLRDYLDYAASGRLERRRGGGEADSDFELFVAEALARRGYEVEHQIGVAGFFIDLAVRHPHVPFGYLLGIECDGATYHASRSARDRDALRQTILERLGWRILRVWSTDWFRDPRRELDRLCSRIDQIAAEAAIVRDLEVEEVIESPAPAPARTLPLPLLESAGPALAARPEPATAPISVEIGDRVVFAFDDDPQRRITVEISPTEDDPDGKIVHVARPLARALLGAAVGDEVEPEAGGRKRVARIVEIHRED